MALKAGLVGVNPKGVDKNGMPIASGGAVDAYTKAETNTLLSGKADKSTLTANSKEFNFAYSGGKYGYKAGATGEFHPFEEAGVTLYGWVQPADLITTGVTPGQNLSVADGGYVIKGNLVIVDMVIYNDADTQTEAGGVVLEGLPGTLNNYYYNLFRTNTYTTLEQAKSARFFGTGSASFNNGYVSADKMYMNPGIPSKRYQHIFGYYEKTT